MCSGNISITYMYVKDKTIFFFILNKNLDYRKIEKKNPFMAI